MNATSLLVSTTRLVLQAEANGTADSANMSDLFRLVPYLRQSLSCTVCGSLLIEPYTPQATQCQHHVCRTCLGGRKSLKPTCHACRDYQKYEVNTQLRILLQCYKGLCEYIVSKPMYSFVVSAGAAAAAAAATGHQPNSINNTTSNGTSNTSSLASNSLVELIEEGARFKDNYKSNSGLLKSTYSMLPCVYNTLPVPVTSQHQPAAATSVFSSADATPSTTFNSSSSQSVTLTSAAVHQQQQQQPQQQHIVRPTTMATISATSSSASTYSNQTTSYSSMVDIKPDIKTLNIVRTMNQPQQQQPPMVQIHSQQQKTATQIQITTQHQQQQSQHLHHHHQKPTTVPTVINQTKQKMWMTTMSTNKPSTIRPHNMIPIQNSTSIYQTTTQVQNKSIAPMKTVSNGSPMYSVMYAGTGNKITIKRKTDPVDSSEYSASSIRVNPSSSAIASATSSSSTSSSTISYMPTTTQMPLAFTETKIPAAIVQTHHLPIPSSTTIRPHPVHLMATAITPTNISQPNQSQQQQQSFHQPTQQHTFSIAQIQTQFQTQQQQQQQQQTTTTIVSQQQQQQQQQNFKKPVIARSKAITAAAAAKRKGCRCGNATPTPGKLTCCGQRCPCYVDAKSCVDCKCRGCRNPHRADGFKVRPHIPELNTIELIDSSDSASPLANMDIQLAAATDRFGGGVGASNSTGGSASHSSSSSGNSIVLTSSGSAGFATIPHVTNNSVFGSSGGNRLDGIDAATLQSLDQDSIVFNPDDVEDTNFQVVNVFASQMPSISYSTLPPSFIVQDPVPTATATPSTSFFSTTPSAATLSATPQTNLLATDDDDDDEADANDLISTTLRAAPALVQKYKYHQPMLYETNNSAHSSNNQIDVKSSGSDEREEDVADEEEEEDEDEDDEEEEEDDDDDDEDAEVEEEDDDDDEDDEDDDEEEEEEEEELLSSEDMSDDGDVDV